MNWNESSLPFLQSPRIQNPSKDGWINSHLLAWRYLIFYLTQVETDDAKFQNMKVWPGMPWRNEP